MKKNEYERLDRQYILKLQREKDSLAEEIIDLKKEIEFLNCLLRVNDLQFVLRVPIINNYYLVFQYIILFYIENKTICGE